jgi:hypothetical protein
MIADLRLQIADLQMQIRCGAAAFPLVFFKSAI